jgi:hypothetical protein
MSQNEHEITNPYSYSRREPEEIEIRLDLYHKIARQLWAIMILIAQLDTGAKPNWRKN